MRKKIWITVIAIILIVAVGTTVAFAADDEGTWRGFRRHENHEERLAQLVEDGLLTQTQADSIEAGDAHIGDYIDRDSMPGRGMGGPENHEGLLVKLVEDGLLTQEQADSIEAGDAHIGDFIDRDSMPGRGMGRSRGKGFGRNNDNG